MVEILNRLKDCLYSVDYGEFTYWLLNSNCNRINPPYIKEEMHKSMTEYIENQCLGEILNVLINNPEADYFWYTYPENGGKLTWSEPDHDVVPSNSLRVDKQKIKALLRDIKIDELLKV